MPLLTTSTRSQMNIRSHTCKSSLVATVNKIPLQPEASESLHSWRRVTRRQRLETDKMSCACGRGVSYCAAEACGVVGVSTDTTVLVPLEALARGYVERGWVRVRCQQQTLEHHYDLLRGAWHAPPGTVRRELIDEVYTIDSAVPFDRQFETRNGQLKELVPLDELKRAREEKQKGHLDQNACWWSAGGYDRPNRKHRALAHECNRFHSKLDFYGKSWIRGHDQDGVPNIDKYSYALEMDHMTLSHFELGIAAHHRLALVRLIASRLTSLPPPVRHGAEEDILARPQQGLERSHIQLMHHNGISRNGARLVPLGHARQRRERRTVRRRRSGHGRHVRHAADAMDSRPGTRPLC